MTAARKPRPRRIAADEAHAWARNLRLGNPYAKLVLSMLTLYVNGDGSCYVAISTLAEDCELAENTVRRRLAFLEQIGAIARFPQWRDEHGRLNGEGKGRRTTDDIRLLTTADTDEIEAKALGNGCGDEPQDDEIRGSPDEPLESVSPSLGVQLPSHCGESLTSEPEPEKNPQPPKGGGHSDAVRGLEEEIAPFIAVYPIPITDLPRAVAVWQAMKPEERADAVLGAKGYAEFLNGERKRGRSRGVKDAHRWLRDRQWVGYVPAGQKAEVAALATQVETGSETGRALAVLHKIAHITPMEFGGKYLLAKPLSAQALALAHAPPEDQWIFIPAEEVHQCRAWTDLLARELAGRARPSLVWDRNPGRAKGFMAPWLWPPRKDGSLCTGPPPGQLSEEDAKAFTQGV